MKADLITDGAANLLTKLLGYAVGNGYGGNPSRLRTSYDTREPSSRLKAHLRYLCRLT